MELLHSSFPLGLHNGIIILRGDLGISEHLHRDSSAALKEISLRSHVQTLTDFSGRETSPLGAKTGLFLLLSKHCSRSLNRNLFG